MKVKSLSRVQLFATPWTVAHRVPLSMEFPRPEYRSGLPFPSPGDFPDPGIEPGSPELQADALLSESPNEQIQTTNQQQQTLGAGQEWWYVCLTLKVPCYIIKSIPFSKKTM